MNICSKLMHVAAETGWQRYVGANANSILFTRVTSSCVVTITIEVFEKGNLLKLTASAGLCVPIVTKTKVAKHVVSSANSGWGSFSIEPESGLLIYGGYLAVTGDALTTALLENLMASAVSAWHINFRTLVRLAYTKTSASAIAPPAARTHSPEVVELPIRRKRGRPRKNDLPPAAYA